MIEQQLDTQQFYDMYLEFHEKIFHTHVKCMQHLVAVLPFEKLNQIDIAAQLNFNKPILNENNLIIEEKELEFIFDLILPILKKYLYHRKEQILRFENLNDKRKFSIQELVAAHFGQEKKTFKHISQNYDIPVILLERISELTISPYLELCAEFFNKKVAQFKWNRNFCPICGNLPSMAKVEEQKGTRTLWCHHCDSTWQFGEMTCPYCLNDDLKSIQIIFASNGKPIRLDACTKCKNYIKTIDERAALKDYNMSVKNVETLYLDITAKFFNYHIPNHTRFYLESI